MEIPLVGNLTDDPVFVAGEAKARMSFTVAVNDSFKDAAGNWQDREPMFWTCWAWDKKARNLAAANLVKGTPVTLTGKVRANAWQDPDGKKHRRNVVDVISAGINVCQALPATVTARQSALEIGEDRTNAWDQPAAPDQA